MTTLEMENDLVDFQFYARNFPMVTRRTQLEIIGRCLGLKHIEEIVAMYKDGWLGLEGNFARIIARMLSQFD
jgi:hypothetical protein